MKKLTKKDYFLTAINFLNAMETETIATVKEQAITTDDLSDFFAKEIAQLEKKNNSSSEKLTEKQKENEALKTAILNWMNENPDKGYSVSDLIKNVPELAGMSNQKVSAVIRLMKENDKTIKKEMVKRVATFSLNDEE